MKVMTMILIAFMALLCSAATPTITGVTAQQRYPWNGKVDIKFEIVGDLATGAARIFALSATDRVTGMNYVAAASALSGDVGTSSGVHHVIWDMDAQGLEFKSTNVVFKVTYAESQSESLMYCVVDLSAGPNALSYPVTYLAAPPSGGFNTDEYKTTKIVLRRIEAGSFIMGDDQNDESYRVTLTKPFFCGIFEVTQKQYTLVMGANPCSSTSYGKGDTYPVHNVSYDMIRGTLNGTTWPIASTVDLSSFMGKLRRRTNLDFDLPTEAQWEYACRAGTTTTYSYGNSANGNYMWYKDNSGNTTHPVGSKSANPWGLYDMHGNVAEWCLDWSNSSLLYGTDPIGPSWVVDYEQYASGYFYYSRVIRGGGWYDDASGCASSYRRGSQANWGGGDIGFRLVRTLSE